MQSSARSKSRGSRPRTRKDGPLEEDGIEADRELILEDARSLGDALWRMARYAHDAAEALDSRIEDEDLDGVAEAVEVRDALDRLQALSLEVSEELDACQKRHAHQEM